jgi:hypothetical protein
VEYPARRGESYSGTTWRCSGYFCSHIFRGKPRWHGDFDEKGLEKSIFALLDAVDRRFGVGLLQFTLGMRPGFESVSNQSFGWSSHFGFRGATSMARVDCIQGSQKAIQPQLFEVDLEFMVGWIWKNELTPSGQQLSAGQQIAFAADVDIDQAGLEYDDLLVGSLSGSQTRVGYGSGEERMVFQLETRMGRKRRKTQPIGFGVHRPGASQVVDGHRSGILNLSGGRSQGDPEQGANVQKQGLP